jgi:hypothetical protein
MVAQRPESVPQTTRSVYEVVTGLTDRYCRDHVDEEFATLCRHVAAALARKRPSPLMRGKPEVWACAIAYALAQVNFLFGPSQSPHTAPRELSSFFGLAQTTAGNKARQIRELLNMDSFDPAWSRPSQIDQNPVAWMVTVNGFIVDARSLPRELQEEAYRKGLIPYLPEESG